MPNIIINILLDSWYPTLGKNTMLGFSIFDKTYSGPPISHHIETISFSASKESPFPFTLGQVLFQTTSISWTWIQSKSIILINSVRLRSEWRTRSPIVKIRNYDEKSSRLQSFLINNLLSSLEKKYQGRRWRRTGIQRWEADPRHSQ